MPVKYVFVTGGVVSGLGKGITAASLGRLLKARGYQVTMQKFDPYINIDPGTMNPVQHGEVFVTDDGTETDLDLGHYERFIDENLDKHSNVTTGKVYWSVLQKERRGDYGGGTVQVIPHITNEIKSRFYRNYTSEDMHIAIIEIGGTVGDIESQPFLEAIRQFQHEAGRENAILIHVTLIPYLKASGEMKTKPTQTSVKALQSMGIQPDIIVCRTELPLEKGIKDKISLFCNVPKENVLQNLDVEYLYEAPLAMEQAVKHCTQGIGIWDWASNDCGEEPDIVMACCGDTPTLETMAAVTILRDEMPELKIRVVNVVDLFKMQSDHKHPHGLSDAEYDMIFTKDRPIIFAFHGYPTLIHELTYERTNHNISVHGYQEEGTITTPFDMRVQNQIDRFNLVKDAILHLPELGNRGSHLIQMMNDKLIEHKQYIAEYGQDMEEIRNWEWHVPEN